MEPATSPTAPPVVAVVVAHEPGPWFDEVLDALAHQDYPNLRTLFLLPVEGQDADPTLVAAIARRVPDGLVRVVPANPGFGAAANEALRLVEGAGFFCFLHDDVALAPDAVSELVAEIYRSNAGIVGPKLVDWDHPSRLQDVGLGADRLGVVLPAVEPGKLDQEQHDAVRDVFTLPTACLLVRIDLFRALGGFAEDIEYHGDGLDLCWRAHLSGARVMVVPSARARHRGELVERRPDLDHVRLSERARVRTALSTPSAANLVWLVPLHLVSAVVNGTVGLVTGHARQATAALASTFGQVLAFPAVLARRRRIQRLRQVRDTEVASLQIQGSAQLRAYRRARTAARAQREAARVAAGDEARAPRMEGVDRWSAFVWAAVVVLLVVGSRRLITGGVPVTGELLGWPGDARDPWRTYLAGWWGQGLGAAQAVPTGMGGLGLAGIVLLGADGLARTLLVLVPLLLGALGVWRLTRPFGARPAQAALVVYTALPLAPNAVGGGSLSGVLAFGATPWVALLLGRLGGWAPLRERGRPGLRARREVADVLRLGALTAAVAAFVPVYPLVVALVALAGVAGGLLGGAGVPWRTQVASAGRVLGGTVGALALTLLLHLPWATNLVPVGRPWWTLVGLPPSVPVDRGIVALAHFDVGPHHITVLALGLAVPLLYALLAAAAERFAWAARAVVMGTASLLVAWLADRGTIEAPGTLLAALLAPYAVALALGAATAVAAFEADVRGRQLTWRQPLGLVALAAAVVGVVPAVPAVAGGRWEAQDDELSVVLRLLPATEGRSRTLWVGTPEDLPVPGWPLAPGLAYALTPSSTPTLAESWLDEPSSSEERVLEALDLAVSARTDRLGRLLGPLGVRYVMVPAPGEVVGGPTVAPFLDSLGRQLDLERVELGQDAYEVYVNGSFVPVRASLSGDAAAASRQGGPESLTQTETAGGAPVLPGSLDTEGAGPVDGEVVTVAETADPGWRLTVDGTEVERRPAFGWANGWDLGAGGRGVLRFDTPLSRTVVVAVQALLWVLVLAGAALLRTVPARRRVAVAAGEGPAIDLGPAGEGPAIDLGPAGAAGPAEAGGPADAVGPAGTAGPVGSAEERAP